MGATWAQRRDTYHMIASHTASKCCCLTQTGKRQDKPCPPSSWTCTRPRCWRGAKRQAFLCEPPETVGSGTLAGIVARVHLASACLLACLISSCAAHGHLMRCAACQPSNKPTETETKISIWAPVRSDQVHVAPTGLPSKTLSSTGQAAQGRLKDSGSHRPLCTPMPQI